MDQLLRSMKAYAVRHNVPVIGPEGAALLAATVAEKQPVSILEIGAAIGYSTLLMAGAAPDTARITTLELDTERAAVAREFIVRSAYADRIELVVGDAAQVLPGLAGRYDLVFIDAAKGQYLDYLGKILDKLEPGAVVVADNVLFRGMVLDGGEVPRRFKTIVKRLRDYLAFVTGDARFDTTIHRSGDGMAISYFRGATKT
jgi:predicted O-methyltransferase YrrM